MNCADNSGAKSESELVVLLSLSLHLYHLAHQPNITDLYVISVIGFGARLNRLPAAAAGDMVMASVKKGKPELRKKGKQRPPIFSSTSNSNLTPSHARRHLPTAKALEAKGRYLPLLRGQRRCHRQPQG